jgi:hypothetical protein
VTGLERSTPTIPIVLRTRPSLRAGTAAWTSWATTRRLSRKRTGTSIQSAFTRCRWGSCRLRLTVLVCLPRRLLPVLTRSMLGWVALARVCRLCRIRVLCPVSLLLRRCLRLLRVKKRRVRLPMNFQMSRDSSLMLVLRSLLFSVPRMQAQLDRNFQMSQGSSLNAVLRLRQSSAPPIPAHRQGQAQEQRVPA